MHALLRMVACGAAWASVNVPQRFAVVAVALAGARERGCRRGVCGEVRPDVPATATFQPGKTAHMDAMASVSGPGGIDGTAHASPDTQRGSTCLNGLTQTSR
jgi:hypothetical protein